MTERFGHRGAVIGAVVVRWDEDPDFGVRLGFDDPHCEDFSPKDFYPSGKKCWRVRAA
jgi:hypothetical protein